MPYFASRAEIKSFLLPPCRDIFPTGLPEQFSFVCSFRARKVPKTSWHLLRVTGASGATQLAVQLNPQRESVELQLADYQGQPQTIAFTNAVVSGGAGPRRVGARFQTLV